MTPPYTSAPVPASVGAGFPDAPSPSCQPRRARMLRPPARSLESRAYGRRLLLPEPARLQAWWNVLVSMLQLIPAAHLGQVTAFGPRCPHFTREGEEERRCPSDSQMVCSVLCRELTAVPRPPSPPARSTGDFSRMFTARTGPSSWSRGEGSCHGREGQCPGPAGGRPEGGRQSHSSKEMSLPAAWSLLRRSS